eukprot:scaffold212_cov173-Amphora_coffeaeformis.AAC.22
MSNPVDQVLNFYENVPEFSEYDEYIMATFPGALSNWDLRARVVITLQSKGCQAETTLLATSLCSDELARQLQDDFGQIYGNSKIGFENMASHSPGSCLLIYGPHVGVSCTTGDIGIVERTGIEQAESCCASAIAACQHHLNGPGADSSTSDFTDFQQGAVRQLVAPHMERLRQSENAMLELPYTLFETQDQLLAELVQEGFGGIKNSLILLGGITINTAPQATDYFLPLRFDYLTKDEQGQPVVENMMDQLR